MYYIYQILAAILIGTCIGACLSKRDQVLLISSLVGIALGVVTVIFPSWLPLLIGAVVALAGQAMQRDTKAAA